MTGGETDLTGGEADLEARVLAAVAATGADHEVITIDPALADTADFCAHYGYPLAASANCLVVATREEQPRLVACVVLATTRLDVNRRVRRRLQTRRCSFATAEQTLAATGMQLGGVTPFGLPGGLPLWVDARVLALPQVIVGGGSRRLKLAVDPAALLAVGGEAVTDLAIPLPGETATDG